MVTALHALIPTHGDVVAQVVKAKLAVGSIGDVSQVGLLAGDWSEQIGGFSQRALVGVVDISPVVAFRAAGRLEHAHAQTEHAIDRAHPASIAPGQVIVDGDQVRAFAFQRVQVER